LIDHGGKLIEFADVEIAANAQHAFGWEAVCELLLCTTLRSPSGRAASCDTG
jgi:hypothetical protein